jgi:hypothetical protein
MERPASRSVTGQLGFDVQWPLRSPPLYTVRAGAKACRALVSLTRPSAGGRSASCHRSLAATTRRAAW